MDWALQRGHCSCSFTTVGQCDLLLQPLPCVLVRLSPCELLSCKLVATGYGVHRRL